MKKRVVFLVTVALAVVSITLLLLHIPQPSNVQTTITIYRTELCPCCEEYERYLRDMGLAVRGVIVDAQGLENMRRKLEVPKELTSCHTMEADGYFVEGHVPVEAINKLLAEKPVIDGIAIPGMPSGAPGMGGIKNTGVTIYAKNASAITPWMVW